MGNSPYFICFYMPHFSSWASEKYTPSQVKNSVIIHKGEKIISVPPSPPNEKISDPFGKLSISKAKIAFKNGEFREYDEKIDNYGINLLLVKLLSETPFIKIRNDKIMTGLCIFVQSIDSEQLTRISKDLKAYTGVGLSMKLAFLAALASIDRKKPVYFKTFDRTHLSRVSMLQLRLLNFSYELLYTFQVVGLLTVWDVFQLTKRQLTTRFGKEGTRLYEFLHINEENKPLAISKPISIKRTHYLEYFLESEKDLLEITQNLVLKILSDIPFYLGVDHITTLTRTRGKELKSERILKDSSRDSELLVATATMMLKEIIPSPNCSEISIEVIISQEDINRQLSLFNPKGVLEACFELIYKRFPNKIYSIKNNSKNSFLEEDKFILHNYVQK